MKIEIRSLNARNVAIKTKQNFILIESEVVI